MSTEDMADQLQAAADRMNERINTAHERVACPRCRARAGMRCHGVNAVVKKALEHSHKERLRADGISLR
jgi:anaerobic selenocysteine-containing dehydrogenase